MSRASPTKDKNEIVGVCCHPSPDHDGQLITWDKAKRKCIKNFRRKCIHFIERRVE